jgi:hypothetical protein
MKKLLVTALVGSLLVGGVVLAKNTTSPEAKTCIKMHDLCASDEKVEAEKLDKCVDDMKRVKKLAGEKSFDKTAKCVDESSSCAAAVGCWGGGVGLGAMGEMMKGFGNAMTQ